MKPLFHFVVTLLAYALCDLAWLNLFARNFVQRSVGHFLAPKPDLAAAAVFYLIFTTGLLYFCVWPAATQRQAMLNGALFGLVTYGTYELVNKALLDRWPLSLVLVDMAWGVLVGAVVSWMSFKIRVFFQAP
ncbi:MAG: DUF2177 family protein [Saprospiraceae bacterium]|nr:DUF2177 family protein [Saprospiraceae bacterium]